MYIWHFFLRKSMSFVGIVRQCIVALFLQRGAWVSISLLIQLNSRGASLWVDWFTNIYLSLLDYYNLRLETYIIYKFTLYNNFLSRAVEHFFYTKKEEEFKVVKERAIHFSVFESELHVSNFDFSGKTRLHPRNPPDRGIQIPRYLAVRIQIEI